MKIRPLKKLKITYVILFLIGSIPYLQAKEEPISEKEIKMQEEIVTGTVTNEDGQHIPGVSVVEKGTNNGTVTDFDGNYTLEISNQDAILVFSYLGFETVEIPVDDQEIINVSLSYAVAQLEEMVVVGYKSQAKSKITGAVSSLNMEEIESRRVPTVAQALQGQIAGVNITSSTGAPGDEIEVRIRGNGTIGNNNPLYVIDGIPSREISFLNPSDIKSMIVLKDAAAAAIYGSRAAGGVIVIETKTGADRSGLRINYYAGFQKVTNLPNMLNAEQYMETVEQAWENAGYEGTNPYTADLGRADFADVDYLEELFELGKMQNVKLSASGGNEKTNYYVSAGYFEQNGPVVFDNDKYRRINFRSNIQSDLNDRIRLGANLQVSHERWDEVSSQGDASSAVIRHAFLRPPVIPVYKDPSDPTYSEEDPFTDLPFYVSPDNYESSKYELTRNPIAVAYFTDGVTNQFKTFGNIFAEYQFLEDRSLSFRTNFGANINFIHNKAFFSNFGDDDGGGAAIDSGLGRANRPNGLNESRGEDITLTWNNTFSYDKEFGNHTINALVGSEFITNSVSNINASRRRYDFTQPNFRYIDFGGTELDLWNGGTGAKWALLSFFSSATYSYKDKYIVAATFRADASSRFSEENKWGYFPSFSAGWMISDEEFANNLPWLSMLKLRGSWGQLGNQEIPNFAFLTLYRRDAGRYLISRYGNPDLKWETSTQTNFGMDYGLFNNKISGSINYFEELTSDILLPVSLPQFVGDVSPTYINAGEVSNKGLEFAISYRNYENDFQYKIGANFSYIKNEVVSLHPNLPYIDGAFTRTQPGHPLNAYYGFVQAGIYQNEAEISEHLFGATNPAQQPGDIKFKDLDGNGIINDKDRTFIGNPNPRLSFGMNVNLNYKSFDFSLLFQGVSGVERYNELKDILDYDTRPFNYTNRVLNSWDGEGSTNVIPRVSFTDNGGSKFSDIFVEDASYIRLKNIELGYTFNLEKSLGISNIRIYASGQNVLTFTDYTGLDPESTGIIDYGTYPQSLTVLFGINASL